ncbi:MAG: hypothetical protein Q9M32_04275 [Sulfurimonas sp.]|nr:hypothetical protein [Sulfurimonas sp.]MDQ7061973.1 hypothetical protein [Sulfurimonas sp.]
MKEAKLIIEEYGLSTDESTFEVVLEVISKFGTARNVLIEGLKPEYMYLKKLSKLLAMLDEKPVYDTQAEDISSLMHSINHVVTKDSQSEDKDFLTLLNSLDIRKTFNPSEMQIWVMNYIGGRELIAKINLQEANQLIRRITNAIEMYERNPEVSEPLAIQNNAIKNMKLIH